MTPPPAERAALSFELAAAGCLQVSPTTVVVHLRGRWHAGSERELAWPRLLVDGGGRVRRLDAMRLGHDDPPVAAAEPEQWAVMYAVPMSMFRRVERPELSLEVGGTTILLPGGDGAWERWREALAHGDRPDLLEHRRPAAVAASAVAPEVRPPAVPKAPAPWLADLPADESPLSAIRRATVGAEPLVAAGIVLVVVAVALGVLPIVAARPAALPVFLFLGGLVALIARQPAWAIPSFVGLTWMAIPGSFFGGLPSPVESLGLILLGVTAWTALNRLELARQVVLFCVLIGVPLVASWALTSTPASFPVDQLKDLSFLAIVAFGLSRLRDVDRVATVLTVAGLVLGTGALFSVYIAETALFPLEIDPFGVEAPRAAGPFGESNFFALSLAVLIPLALYVAGRGGGTRRLLGIATIVVCFGGIVAAGSRGGVIAATVGLIGAALAARGLGGASGARQLRLAAVAALIGVVALAPSLETQIQSSTERGVSGRATENLVALAMFADHPVSGVGPVNYPDLYRDYSRNIGSDDRVERYPHSLPLEIAAEQGLAGIVGWLAAAALVLQFVRSRKVWDVPVGRALLMSILVFLVGSLFLHSSLVRLLYVLVGAVFAVGWAAGAARPVGRPA